MNPFQRNRDMDTLRELIPALGRVGIVEALKDIFEENADPHGDDEQRANYHAASCLDEAIGEIMSPFVPPPALPELRKYDVEVTRHRLSRCTFEVEASTASEASDRATVMAKESIKDAAGGIWEEIEDYVSIDDVSDVLPDSAKPG